MYCHSLYLLLLPCLFIFPAYESTIIPTSDITVDTGTSDSCRKVVEYVYSHKVLEGMVCNDKREGIWMEWDVKGNLKDSALYHAGVRQYTDKAAIKAKGVLIFRGGEPKVFYKDSTYECAVKVNMYHGMRDIKGDYAGISDTIYPPLLYFGADMGARDSFNYYFTPKSAGKYKLRISLSGDAASLSGGAPFFEKTIEVVRR